MGKIAPMNDAQPESPVAPLTPEERHAAMFAQMVMQLASTALVLMGHMPNPMTGKAETDLDSAQLFIDQLEMLEVKTKGNLSPDEQHLLKQNLMTVRLAFVQAVQGTKQTPAPDGGKEAPPTEAVSSAEPEDGTKKKFTKSYGAQ